MYERLQILEESSFTLGTEGIHGCEDDDMQIEVELLHFGIINLRKKESLFSIVKSHRAWRILLHPGRREVPDIRLECLSLPRQPLDLCLYRSKKIGERMTFSSIKGRNVQRSLFST